MSKVKKFNIFLGTIFFIIVALSATYYIGFYPKTEVKNINSSSNFNEKILLDKLTANHLNLSSKEISLETSLTLSEDDLTDLFISLIKDSNAKISDTLTGLKVDIADNKINILFHLKYNGIPLEGNMIFTGKLINNKCTFHYESGHLGFININKDLVFSRLKSNEFIYIDKNSGDIVLANNLKGIEIKDFKVNNNEIIIDVKGTLTLDDLKKLR
ncbi:hypothetical protein UT300005_00380 [Clostridium sp. CTA-5]